MHSPSAAPWFLSLALCTMAAAGCSSTQPSAPESGSRTPVDTPVGTRVEMASAPASSAAHVASPAGAPKAPDFTLRDSTGRTHSLADYRGKWVVLEWVNPGCPFVRKHYDSKNMQNLQAKYAGRGVTWLSICSSAPGKQGYDEPAGWNARLEKEGAGPTALLIDSDGKVGHLYDAKTTPHMFVIDPNGAVVYRGAIDDKKSANASDIPTSRNYVTDVLDACLAGKPSPVAETAPYGCSVKY